MKSSTKLAIAIGTILAASAGYILYDEGKKMMKYGVSFKSAKIKTLTAASIVADLWFNFKNPSNLKITLAGVRYDVYIDGVFATTLQNNATTTIMPQTTSVLGLQMAINPKEFLQSLPNPALALLDLKQLPVRLDMKFTVKIIFLKMTIPYVYAGKLKDFV